MLFRNMILWSCTVWALAWVAPRAEALLVGPAPGNNPYTTLYYHTGGTHYLLPETSVSFGAGHPYWIKQLDASGAVSDVHRPVLSVGDTLKMVEYIRITGDQPMANWSEVFSVDGWSFQSAVIYLGETAAEIDGLNVSTNQNVLQMQFDPVAAGALLRIEKTLRFDGLNSHLGSDQWGSDRILIRQFAAPFIPEPATLSLLALGMSSMVTVMRRRKS